MSEPGYSTAMHMFGMLRMLQARGGRGMPVNDLAEDLGVHRRTVVRYLKALSASVDDDRGEPIVRREHRDGVAWAVLNGVRSSVAANVYQYAAVFAATRHLGHTSVLKESADNVLDRVEEMDDLPPALVARVASSFHYVGFGPKDYGSDERVLDVLIRATLHRRLVCVHYKKPGQDDATVRQLEPWTLVMYRDGLYLLARDAVAPAGVGPRLFAVDRMDAAGLFKGSSFEIPEDYDPDAFFEGQLGLWQTDGPPERVRLAFEPSAAWWARERSWPGFVGWSVNGQRHILELDVPVTPEVIAWATAWGPGLEVLAPVRMREAVADRHAAALARYRPATDGEPCA